ncbi:MAG: glycosyltransferase family 9 protein [Deferrisomatales bacterium]
MSRNLLVIQLRQIGDVVLTTPIPRILKEELPGCRVAFLTEAPSHELLRENPWIDRVLVHARRGGAAHQLALARRLRRERYDAVLDFMANPRSALLAYLSGAPVRVSYPVRGRGLLYTHRVAPELGYPVAYKKSLLGALGIRSGRDRPEIHLTDDELRWGRELRARLLGGRPGRLVTVDPTHRRPSRRWPEDHWGRLAAGVADRAGARPVILWGPGEEAAAEEVLAHAGGRAVRAPRLTLRRLASLIAAADLHLGNCSAPRHIAVAVGTPSFTVLGSSSGDWTHPAPEHAHLALGLGCQPCKHRECPRGTACLVELEPSRVLDRLLEWAGNTLGWRDAG